MTMTMETARGTAQARQELCGQVKKLLVDRLSLDVDPAMIGDDQPLFGRGLELDSIDTLELAVAVQEELGVTITDDDNDCLLSLNRLVDHIESNRA
jgi:acyl carrier protein